VAANGQVSDQALHATFRPFANLNAYCTAVDAIDLDAIVRGTKCAKID
jgi:hypothetical protein